MYPPVNYQMCKGFIMSLIVFVVVVLLILNLIEESDV